MKINKIIFFLFFTVSLAAQSNLSGFVIYESSINSKKLEIYLSKRRNKIKNKRLLESLDKVYLSLESIKSRLTFSKGEGVFTVEDKMSTDKNNIAQRYNRISAGGSKKYYYNNISKEYLIKDCDAVGECFIYNNEYLEWKLTQDKMVINGYNCYKATRSNGKVIAWYTPEIPVNFGPKGEYGLPGLILELEVGKIIFKAKRIVLSPKQILKVDPPKKGKRVSKAEYKTIVNKAKESVFGKGK